MQLKNVTLELSSKPFYNDSEAEVRRVAETMFRQWLPLTKHADIVSVMLWIADGSEILQYTGDLQQSMEWAYWIGVANPDPKAPENPSPRVAENTHLYPKKYREDAAPRNYAWLKQLVVVLKEVGAQITGKPIRVGTTFDNGPEFAISDFKYSRHKEIAQAHTIYPNSFVVCTAKLHADPAPYAGFPDGIPEGTSLGCFLGRQFHCFAQDLGFDYIWLSNGMGFGQETWGITGTLFDKQQFHPEKAAQAGQDMIDFWDDFTNNAPGVVIETRGSNFSAGLEISTDGCPLRHIYNNYNVAPPVNSPWAALNYNTGVELAAWMSHICEVPGGHFPYRFYTHDPWFYNSPWLDRYGREPWDIFLPLSISRVNRQGQVEIPNSISLLSVDDTLGRLPDQVPNEVIPHLLEAFNNAPDAIAPFLWLYPFNEYDARVHGDKADPAPIFSEEWFLGAAIQNGLPLNTVVSSDSFKAIIASQPDKLIPQLLFVPISGVDAELLSALKKLSDLGGNILFYGPIRAAIAELRQWLALELAEEVCGEVAIETSLEEDICENDAVARTLQVMPQFNGGGLVEVAASHSTAQQLASATQGSSKRVLAQLQTLANGNKIGYVRSLTPCSPEIGKGRDLRVQAPAVAYPSERLLRYMLPCFGWQFREKGYQPDTLLPRINLSRHDNGFRFAIFAPDTSASILANSPLGAPILTEQETRLENGMAIWQPAKCVHQECRCFVRQEAPSVISAKIMWPAYPGYHSRRRYSGLINAELRFFLPKEAGDKLSFTTSNPDGGWFMLTDNFLMPTWEDTPYGRCAVFTGVNGVFQAEW
jgi:hypothetical protein